MLSTTYKDWIPAHIKFLSLLMFLERIEYQILHVDASCKYQLNYTPL